MGINLRGIVSHKIIDFNYIKNKTISIDAYNAIYQFLSIIRQPDGTSLKDSHGNVTSHLSGIFYRTIKLMKFEIKPVYVFDGKPPELKFRTIERRSIKKEEAKDKWEKALEEGDLEEARKYAKRTSTLDAEMIKDTKKLLEVMGVPYLTAPSEGEAQCAHMCKKDIFAAGTQDYDALLFGAPRIIRNLTFTGERELELIILEDVLKELNITLEQLIESAILVGTDFNEGVKGIGIKTALKKVKEGKLKEIELDFDFEEVKRIFINPKVTDDYTIEWNRPDEDEIINLLCKEHDFSETRVRNGLNELKKAYTKIKQKNLSAWF